MTEKFEQKIENMQGVLDRASLDATADAGSAVLFESPGDITEVGIKDSLSGFVRTLSEARSDLATTKSNEEDAYGFLKETPTFVTWDELKTERVGLAKAEKSIKSMVGDLAKILFSINKETKPHSAITMKKFKTSQITDMDAAIEWCEENAKALIVTSVDEKTLNKMLKAMPEEKRPDWFEFGHEYRPSVATDLSKHVDEGWL